MNKMVKIFGALFVLLSGACGRRPTPSDLFGKWTAPDGATLVLREDGEFTAQALPVNIFISPDQKGPAIDGFGRWALVQGSVYWEVRLNFNVLSGQPSRRESKVLVYGSGSSASLYQWKYEEGSERYEFER